MSVNPASNPDLDLVQIGPVEVDPAALQGPGSSLWDLLGDRRVEMPSPDDVLDLPRQGWRRLVPSRPDVTPSSEVLAAPHRQIPEAWVLVFVNNVDGIWTASTHPGPLQVHRCRAARRLGLELRWPGEHTCTAGTLPEMAIDLVNTAETRWVNDAGDHMTVHGWVLDEKGERIMPGVLLFSHAPKLPDLDPGDRMPLQVNIATRNIEEFSAGRYALVAELYDLQLTSPPGTLILHEPTLSPE
ncbi:hypothetical protein [Rhodococcus rhodochrous]|uniref:hypothetical protein n=1 Tax=Rhodococcus rhodochrous TaxID=1829 RepID=UPI0032DF81F3